jgi:hypothetical protein
VPGMPRPRRARTEGGTVSESANILGNVAHASAPVGYKCADCKMHADPCPACYSAWWRRKYPDTQIVMVGDTVLDALTADLATWKAALIVAEARGKELEAILAAVWNVLAKNEKLFSEACAAVDAVRRRTLAPKAGPQGDETTAATSRGAHSTEDAGSPPPSAPKA